MSAATVRSCMAAATAAIPRQSVFISGIMLRLADVSAPVAGFVAVEVIEPLCSALGHGTVVAVARIEAVIHVAVEAVRPMEPGTGAKEDATRKPVGAVVAVGRAIIGCIVKVSIRADRRPANIDTDGYLGVGHGSAAD